MFAQNNIERWRPLYHLPVSAPPPLPSHSPYFPPIVFSLPFYVSFFFFLLLPPPSQRIRERFLQNTFPRKKEARRACSRSLPIFFCLMRLVKHDVLNTKAPESPALRFARARIFIFHFNFHFSRSTHVHEKGRTLVRNSYSKYTTGRREFTSACRPSDSSCTAKLFSSNYYRPPSNDAGASDAILKIFSKVARRYYEGKSAAGFF